MITKDMLLVDAFKMGNADAMAEVLFGLGMHCLHCAFASGETIEEAAMVHNIDVDEMLEKLNEAAAK